VELDIRTDTRAAERIEVSAYYVVCEPLTNTTKHARASYAHVAVEQRDPSCTSRSATTASAAPIPPEART
jgi:signal transduction histidine kinase